MKNASIQDVEAQSCNVPSLKRVRRSSLKIIVACAIAYAVRTLGNNWHRHVASGEDASLTVEAFLAQSRAALSHKQAEELYL